MAVVAILHPDARASARLSSALAGAHDVVACSDWSAFERAIGGDAVEACIIDAHQDDPPTFGHIAELRSRRSDLAIIASLETDHAEGLFDLGVLGVDGVVRSTSSAGRMKADVDAALSTARARRVAAMLEDRAVSPAPTVVAWAMEQAGPHPSVDRLAAALGHTPGSLREELGDAGLPSPSRLLLWGRLILAGARLGNDHRRVEDVAFSLGYSTGTSFARAMKLHTGLTPAQVTKMGGMKVVLDALFPPPSRPGQGGSAERRPRATFRIASLLLLMLPGCASLSPGSTGIDRGEIERIMERPPLDQMQVGVLAVDARSGRTLFSHNAQRRFIPASNQKILVTATALSLLGPDFRFRTRVGSPGEVRDGVLFGDLVVEASGDPSLSRRFWPSGEAALMAFADSVRERGIHRIAGSLRVDVSIWDSTTVGPTREVDDLRFTWGATGGAFAIDEGEVELVVVGGPTAGSPATVTWSPVGTDDFVRSHLRTVPADSSTRVRPSYLPESRLLELDGTVTLGSVDTLSFAIRDPVRQATAALARSLTSAGVSIDGGWEVSWSALDEMDGPESDGGRTRGRCHRWGGRACRGGDELFTVESPPLAELVRGILEPSQNWMTEQIVRALGARFGSDGSWTEGIGVITSYLVNEVGVDPDDLAARDGSGLSFYNLVTPRALVLILQDMQSGPWGGEYRWAMAEPGEIDSTLEERLTGLEGRVFAKTGSISNVNSLSGYLVGDGGREIVFSILTNGSGLPAATVRDAIDDIVRTLAR